MALVNAGARYVVQRCLADKKTLSTTGYESIVREQTLSGTTAEYFRPNAMRCETFIEPGDEIEILEIDHDHGFIHAEITLVRGNIYRISRVIPLNEDHSNAHRFIVTPLLSEDGIPPLSDGGSPTPVTHAAAETEVMTQSVRSDEFASIVLA